MYKHTYETRYGDYRDFETIKCGSVMDFIQDISTKNSEEKGFGIKKLFDMKLAWLLKGINIHFEKKVSTKFPVEVHTAVKPQKGATSQRGCIIMQNGEVVAKSIADWFLLDTEKMRPTRIPDEMNHCFETHEFDDEFFSFRKPAIIEDAALERTVIVANKDIDTNLHLNNQRGADLLMDVLPFDFDFNNISLLYKKSAYLGEKLDICLEKTGNGYYVHAKNKDGEICIVGRFENI